MNTFYNISWNLPCLKLHTYIVIFYVVISVAAIETVICFNAQMLRDIV